MLKEKGIVQEVLGERVRVAVTRSSMCDHCAESGTCHASGSKGASEVQAINEAEAGVGDLVELALPESSLLFASAMVYLLPVVLLVTGAILGNSFLPAVGLGANASAALGALAGLGCGMFCTWAISRRSDKTGATIPRVAKIIARHTRPVLRPMERPLAPQ